MIKKGFIILIISLKSLKDGGTFKIKQPWSVENITMKIIKKYVKFNLLALIFGLTKKKIGIIKRASKSSILNSIPKLIVGKKNDDITNSNINFSNSLSFLFKIYFF